ncbi:MAG: polyprenyl synthetase family protein [Oligoflexia bacterium]|nr:polyprenyl synthetase family protein [Oligoflexia bacterium]
MSEKVQILKKRIEENLLGHFSKVVPLNHPINQAYRYAVFPPGKLFRPLLVMAIAEDFDKYFDTKNTNRTKIYPNHCYFASAMELHHAYTLVHDDLPCVDNDVQRRGRPTLHVEFGEWQALLVGDGLLNASYQLLAKIQIDCIGELIKFVSCCLGPRGLVQGQVLDLSGSVDFTVLLRMLEYKTSRLIQASLVGSAAITIAEKKKFNEKLISINSNQQRRILLDLFCVGKHLGLVFQLLDDLCDLVEQAESDHEMEVNTFIIDPLEPNRQLLASIAELRKFINKYQLQVLQMVLSEYFFKTRSSLQRHQAVIENKLSGRGGKTSFSVVPIIDELSFF